MATKFIPGLTKSTSSTGSEYLREIADTLGVSEEIFGIPTEPHIIHVETDGTEWLLLCDDEGNCVVRCVNAQVEQRSIADETVSGFLVRDPGSPQCRALMAVIDRLLAAHLRS